MTAAQRSLITRAAARLTVGTPTDLESLIGQQAWRVLTHGERRRLGRQFRYMVTHNQFSQLRYVRKNSANLAQYVRV